MAFSGQRFRIEICQSHCEIFAHMKMSILGFQLFNETMRGRTIGKRTSCSATSCRRRSHKSREVSTWFLQATTS